MLWQSIAFVAIGKALIFTAARPPLEVVALLPDLGLPGAPARDGARERRAARRLHGAQPFDDSLPRSIVILDFILTTGLLAGARIVTRLWIERPEKASASAGRASR